MNAFAARILHRVARRWTRPLPAVTLIGNPYESIGRSEHLRTTWRALAAVSVPAFVVDVYDIVPEHSVALEFGRYAIPSPVPGIRIFHLNGIEIGRALDLLEARAPGCFASGYNIVAPVWELPRYPAHWARELDRFDEIWVPTAFVEAGVRHAVSAPVLRMRNACEPHAGTWLDRACFGIPADALAVLYMFDLRSFVARKNPWAAIAACERALESRPHSKLRLVLKAHHGDRDPDALAAIRERVSRLGDRVQVIDASLTNDEAKSLIRCCDCFLSLHRSEGFGRGPAEAMFLGKPVVATGWSGNMDYMDASRSFPIGYRLVPVGADEYIEHEDQQWAEPDVEQAAAALIGIVDDPAHARAVGKRAARHMRRWYSDAVIGAQLRSRLAAIARTRNGHQQRPA